MPTWTTSGWWRSNAGDSERIRGIEMKLWRGGGHEVAHSSDRAEYMRQRHPAMYAEFRDRIGELKSTFTATLAAYEVIDHA